ncbi:MAG TPA: hypothetical protein VFI74_04515 [Candidatus Saccharimonadales bacterium]|nr:hypothetical protein [Candidatus Saccharimonadales bacterium]
MSFEKLAKPPHRDELAFSIPINATCDYHTDILESTLHWITEVESQDVRNAQIGRAIAGVMVQNLRLERDSLMHNRRISDEVSSELFNAFSIGELLRQPCMQPEPGEITVGEDELATGSVPKALPFLVDIPTSPAARLHLDRAEVADRLPDLPLPKPGQRPTWSVVEGTDLLVQVKGPAELTAAFRGKIAAEHFAPRSMVSIIPYMRARSTGQNHTCKLRGFPAFL